MLELEMGWYGAEFRVRMELESAEFKGIGNGNASNAEFRICIEKKKKESNLDNLVFGRKQSLSTSEMNQAIPKY